MNSNNEVHVTKPHATPRRAPPNSSTRARPCARGLGQRGASVLAKATPQAQGLLCRLGVTAQEVTALEAHARQMLADPVSRAELQRQADAAGVFLESTAFARALDPTLDLALAAHVDDIVGVTLEGLVVLKGGLRLPRKQFNDWLESKRHTTNAPAHHATDIKAQRLAHALSDGARATLLELVALCPNPFDSTGPGKFKMERTARKHVNGELTRHKLVHRRRSQGHLNLSPTDLGRAVAAILSAAG